MDMKGERQVPLERDKAWAALNDPDVLAACIPGCESMEQIGDNEFKTLVKASVGPVSAKFKGKIKLTDVTPPESYKLAFKGDGTAGFAQGTAEVHLTAVDDGTTIAYTANAKIGGKLAQIGSRLVDGAARKMADEFFTNLTTHMGGTTVEQAAPEPPPADSGTAAGSAAPASSGTPAAASGGGGFMAVLRGWLAKLFGRG